MKNLKMLIIGSAMILNYQFSNAQNFNRIAGRAIKDAIGSDLRGYQTFSYPTDNFGLITSYENKVNDKNFICDMWDCIGIKTPPAVMGPWLDLNGYAAVGNNGGSIELSQTKKKKLALKVILPKIYQIIGVTGEVNGDSQTDINLTIGKAYLRKLRREQISTYLQALPNTTILKQTFNAGNLVLIVGDCVIESVSVTVKTNSEFSTALDAKIGAGNSQVFNDAALTVKAERSSAGTYTFKIDRPVIFARLAKQQSSAGYLGATANDDWSDLPTYTFKNDPSLLK